MKGTSPSSTKGHGKAEIGMRDVMEEEEWEGFRLFAFVYLPSARCQSHSSLERAKKFAPSSALVMFAMKNTQVVILLDSGR